MYSWQISSISGITRIKPINYSKPIINQNQETTREYLITLHNLIKKTQFTAVTIYPGLPPKKLIQKINLMRACQCSTLLHYGAYLLLLRI